MVKVRVRVWPMERAGAMWSHGARWSDRERAAAIWGDRASCSDVERYELPERWSELGAQIRAGSVPAVGAAAVPRSSRESCQTHEALVRLKNASTGDQRFPEVLTAWREWLTNPNGKWPAAEQVRLQ